MRPRIHPLTMDTSSAVLQVLDDVLVVCRKDLVAPRGKLEMMGERVLDAEDHRILLWAEVGGRPAGLVDAALHHPTATDLTVRQLAVDRAHRFEGLGRRLVEAALEAARARDVPTTRVFAAVLPWAQGAAAFWSSLGFEQSVEHPDLLEAPATALEGGP